MNRRAFLLANCGVAAGLSSGRAAPGDAIMTVTGPIPERQAGPMLPHEHVMSIFGGDPKYRPGYNEEALFKTVVPYLKRLCELGCRTIADSTAAWFGRAPALLKQISEQTGVQLLTNTGYYGAANDRYVPKHARAESAKELAIRWTAEWKEGIDGTAIRPGFMKIGVDSGPLSELDRKLVRAAALTHAETGLVIAAHTGNNPAAALEQLEVLRSEGVSPEAWIWVHANKSEDRKALLEAAEAGAWLDFDGISADSIEEHLELVKLMRDNGHLSRVLLSHDGNSFRFGGRPPKPYASLFTHFIPALKESGCGRDEIRQLTEHNPARAFTTRKRPG